MKKILALVLSLVMLLSLCSTAFAAYTDAQLEAFGLGGYTPNEIANDQISREIALDSYVLLENNGVLPLKEVGKVALFGNGATGTVKGGTGSGIVNQRERDWIDEALENAGFEITTPQAYRNSVGRGVVATGFSGSRMATDVNITDAWLEEAKAADTAIYVIGRNAGEGSDRQLNSGDGQWNLTNIERNNLTKVAANFENVIVVLNTMISDTSWFEGIGNIDALLHIGYGGQRTGATTVQVLTGEVSPSGKTNSTWAKNLNDYLSSQVGFSWMNNDTQIEYYEDGIYVGYRYFDTFGVDVAYPFGYGLSYTDFDINVNGVSIDEEEISVDVTVVNVGNQYSGKEVIQVYFSAPDGKLEKPYQELAAYGKTDTLAPGEAQKLTIRFATADMSSYDEELAAYILEAGDYYIRVGNSSRNTHVVAAATLPETVITEQLSNQCQLEEDAVLEEVSKEGATPITYEGEAAEKAEALANATVLDVETLEGLAVNNASPYDDETITTYLLSEDYENYQPRDSITIKTKNVAAIINNRPKPQEGEDDSPMVKINKSARYVKIQCSNPATNYGFSFYELYVYSGGENVAKGKTATASSIQTNGGSLLSPNLGIDGATNTRWGSDYNGGDRTNSWFIVDLGAEYAIEGVAMLWEAAYARNVDIQLSSDGENFVSAATAAIPGTGMTVSGGSTQITGYSETTYAEVKEDVGTLPEGITKENAKLTDVVTGKITLEQFVACLSNQELARLAFGAGAVGGVGKIYDDEGNVIATSSALPGNVGRTTEQLFASRHIPVLGYCDGPAGIRCDQGVTSPRINNPGDKGGTYFYSNDGGITIVNQNTQGAVKYNVLPTAFPCSSNLASTWNEEVIYSFGYALGAEQEEYHVGAWLAPGMNIVRNPMCGRNFEYYSEDPLVTGITCANVTAGVQSHKGGGVTIKHYWANNQENNRNSENNVISERAAREIYLKGYEIAIKLAQPLFMMTSYNENNGWPSGDNYDACTDLARGEWGFNGLIMTDWNGGQSSPHVSMHAGNDMITPGNRSTNNIINYLGITAPTFNADGSIRNAGSFVAKAGGSESYKVPTNVESEEFLPSAVAAAVAAEQARYDKIGDDATITWYGEHYNRICRGDVQKSALNILKVFLYSIDMQRLCEDLDVDYSAYAPKFSEAMEAPMASENYVGMCIKSDVENVGIFADTVTVDAVGNESVSVPVTYEGDEDITSVRLYIDSALPIPSDEFIVSENDFEFNPADGWIVVYSGDGGPIDHNLFSIVYELEPTIPDGEYPIDLTLIDVTGPDGAPTFAVTIDGAVIIDNNYPKGDVSQDGEVTNADLIMIARYLVHLVEFNDKQKEAADFNNDGQINNTDLVLIARAIVAG